MSVFRYAVANRKPSISRGQLACGPFPAAILSLVDLEPKQSLPIDHYTYLPKQCSQSNLTIETKRKSNDGIKGSYLLSSFFR